MAKKIPAKQGPDMADTEAPPDETHQNDSEAKPKPKKLGTAKAVETMFRNAYRAELDTIALAATKANIMISLNGFIISALMISGAFIFASSPAFLLPAGVFLFTAASSIIFALLSASPERADLFTGLWDWIKALLRREAGLRDLRKYVLQASNPDPSEQVNILIYEDRVRLTRADYWARMQELMHNREQIYYTMSDQLYWLGLVTDRKFRLLNVSYTIFRWGLLASVVTFIGLKSLIGLFATGASSDVIRLRNVGIGSFEGIYEPSAVQQLPDGRLLVVEDEASRAMNLLSLSDDGTLIEDQTAGVKLMRGFGRKLSDLEGLSLDENGYIYATTSHSLNKDGERKPDREQLLRFRIAGGAVGNISNFNTLRDALAGDKQLAATIKEQTGQDLDFRELNIEGLAYFRERKHLYLGLRAPMIGDKSLIVVIENPSAVFDGKQAPKFGAPILLDLKDGGIRALSYDPVLKTFLIVNEIEGYDDNRYSQLWSWSGDPAHAPEPIALPDIINLNNVESIDSIMVDGVPQLLIMSDEGSEKKNEPARYMMLDYTQLTE